jgi:hypothetical protein
MEVDFFTKLLAVQMLIRTLPTLQSETDKLKSRIDNIRERMLTIDKALREDIDDIHEQMNQRKPRIVTRAKLEKFVAGINEIVNRKQATINPEESVPEDEPTDERIESREVDRENIANFKQTIDLFRQVKEEISIGKWGERMKEALDTFSSDLSVYLPAIAILNILMHDIKSCPIPTDDDQLVELRRAWKKASIRPNILPFVIDYYILGQREFEKLPNTQVPKIIKNQVLLHIELWNQLYAVSTTHLRGPEENDEDDDSVKDVDSSEVLGIYRSEYKSILSVVCKPKTDFESLLETFIELKKNGYTARVFIKCRRLLSVLCKERDFYDDFSESVHRVVEVAAKKDPRHAIKIVECFPKENDNYLEIYSHILAVILRQDIEHPESFIDAYLAEVDKTLRNEAAQADRCYQILCNELIIDESIPSYRLIQYIANHISDSHRASKLYLYTTLITLHVTPISYEDFLTWLPPEKYLIDVLHNIVSDSDGIASEHFDWMIKLIRRTRELENRSVFVTALGVHHTTRFSKKLKDSLGKTLEECGYEIKDVILQIFCVLSEQRFDHDPYLKLHELVNLVKDYKREILLSSISLQLKTKSLNQALATAKMVCKIDLDCRRLVYDQFAHKIKDAKNCVLELDKGGFSDVQIVEDIITLCRLALKNTSSQYAINLLQAAVLKYPDNRTFVYYRATLHMYRKEYTRMVQLVRPFEESIYFETDHREDCLSSTGIYAFLFYAYVKLNRYDEAQECIEKCKKLKLDYSEFEELFSRAYKALDLPELFSDPQVSFPKRLRKRKDLEENTGKRGLHLM